MLSFESFEMIFLLRTDMMIQRFHWSRLNSLSMKAGLMTELVMTRQARLYNAVTGLTVPGSKK